MSNTLRTPNPVCFATENASKIGAPVDPGMWLRLLITYCKRCRSNMQQGMQGMQGLQPMQQMGPGWGKGPMTPMAPASQYLGQGLWPPMSGWFDTEHDGIFGAGPKIFRAIPQSPQRGSRWEHVEPLVGS